jgi:hypothetical protein
MSSVVFRSRSILSSQWHLASSPVYLKSSHQQTHHALTLEHALPIQAAAAVFNTHTHTHTHTHIGSSETAGLRRWTLHGGKGSLVRQAQASASTFINFNFNLLRSCQALTHSHPRSSCGLLPTAPTRHVTLSNLRHLYSFTTSQTSSFPLRRFKTPTDHVLREPASHPIRHSLRRFTPVLHFRIASLRLGLSVA